MPKTSKTSASETVEVEGYEGHLENFEGGYTVAFEKYTADADLTEYFKGLPDDQCQAPHWGYILAGKVTFKTSSGEETFEISGVTALNEGGIPHTVHVKAGDVEFDAVLRIDTPGEADYYRHGGIMQYVLRGLLTKS